MRGRTSNYAHFAKRNSQADSSDLCYNHNTTTKPLNIVTNDSDSGALPLIPRDLLFGNPERTSPALSPDGFRLTWLAPDSNNILQVWMKNLDTNEERVITADKKRGIQIYFWAKDNRTLLYLQDRDGDENYHLFGVDLATALSDELCRPCGCKMVRSCCRDLCPNRGLSLCEHNCDDKSRHARQQCGMTPIG
ncbi:MAG TPA: hypothetical protein VGY56_02860 [Verrucomicrobiae bacterium]|nr:hypothetical protein [Verrucomicrobiae bacterium]